MFLVTCPDFQFDFIYFVIDYTVTPMYFNVNADIDSNFNDEQVLKNIFQIRLFCPFSNC